MKKPTLQFKALGLACESVASREQPVPSSCFVFVNPAVLPLSSSPCLLCLPAASPEDCEESSACRYVFLDELFHPLTAEFSRPVAQLHAAIASLKDSSVFQKFCPSLSFEDSLFDLLSHFLGDRLLLHSLAVLNKENHSKAKIQALFLRLSITITTMIAISVISTETY